jgi:hypothetical protein
MPIEKSAHYKLIFDEHHYASDFRVKIFTGWCAIYAALALAFVWTYSASKSAAWIVVLPGVVITVLMWSADIRNRAALRASKNAGTAIEEDATTGIPENQRFFSHLKAEGFTEKLFTHSFAIDAFAVGAIAFLILSAFYLYYHHGSLP